MVFCRRFSLVLHCIEKNYAEKMFVLFEIVTYIRGSFNRAEQSCASDMAC